MILYGLRLLVALLTFAVGTAAAWLLDFKSAPASAVSVTRTVAVPVADLALLDTDGAPPPRSCANKRSSTVVAGGIINGKAVRKPVPVYPPAAKAARVSGMVTVAVEVDEGGRVSKAEAVIGPEMLREAAEDAAREARFSPTRLSGEPVRVTGYITYNFILQ
jgi:TonB family protein